MTDRIEDHAERLRALDSSQSFIVQAPAGSGKTELLIQRFLTLLGQVDRPESILAITFTRKAAAEMRHRVIGALQKASEPAPGSASDRATWELARRALERNDARDWSLIDHPSRLRIQTIDSLCATLVARMPWLSRMGMPPEPADDATYLYRLAARWTLEMLDSAQTESAVSGALSKLLSHLDNNVGTVERLLSTMLARRDQWLRHVVGHAVLPDLRGDIEVALGQVIEGELAGVARVFPARFQEETVALARFAARNIVREGGSSPLAACADLRIFPDATQAALPGWLGIAELFVTQSGNLRRQLNKNQGFPPGEPGRTARDRWGAIQLEPAVVARLHGLRDLPLNSFDEAQWDMLGALLRLLPVAVGQLRLVFRQQRRVDFTEISMAARAALGPDDDPTDLAFALDGRIQHLLVDEFQDTSQSQYDLLAGIVREWQPGDGRTLFVVGDPMQSIYGFREADVGLFLRARSEGVGPIMLTPLTLSVNFRSAPQIVSWANRAFGLAFPDEEDMFTGAVTYARSVPHKTEGGGKAVQIHPFLVNDAEEEARQILEIIGQAQSTHPGETIAVLVRSRSHLFALVSQLRRAGKKFRAVDIDALAQRPAVQDLLALTRALGHAGDRVAWLSILRAAWCGLTLADLEALVVDAGALAVWDLLRDPRRRHRMSPDGVARVDRIIPVLSEAIDRRSTLPVRRWVEGAWIALGGPASLDTPTDLEDASAYLDLLERSLDGLDVRDERKFAEDVGRLFALPDVEAGEGLQLLTIHRAKGLEFDTVIVPGLGRRPRGDEPRLLMWMEYMGARGSELLLAPIHEVGGDKDPLYQYLRKVQGIKGDYESIRLLYVAATRARHRLHLLGHARPDRDGGGLKAPESRTLLSKIWDTVEPEFGQAWVDPAAPQDAADTGRPDPTPGVAVRRLARDWEPPTPPREIRWAPGVATADSDEAAAPRPIFEWATELQRRVGNVVHRALQEIQVPNREGISEDVLRLALRSEGLDGSKLDEAVSRAVAALTNVVRDDRGRWILSVHEDGEREYALSAIVDGKLRRMVLDRTFVDGGVRWIIDYKTGTHEGGGRDPFLDNEQERYRQQLEGYASVMRRVDSRPIRLGLYFPSLRGWREWAFRDGPA